MLPYLHSKIGTRPQPAVDARNAAGGVAYSLSAKQALAQYASTGCFGVTFYAGGQEMLENVLKIARQCEPAFVAKCAVYARRHGRLKDMAALLCAYLSTVDTELFRKTFRRTINSGRMLRTFVKLMRGGDVGRKSLGSAPKKAIEEWLESRTDDQIFYDSVGTSPSLGDVIKMVHPEPATKERSGLYRYLVGGNMKKRGVCEKVELPWTVRAFEEFKAGRMEFPPEVNFQMLTSANLNTAQWTQIARQASWTMLRMNLNTFARHGVFQNGEMAALAARRLSNRMEIEHVKPLPYEILAALKNVDLAVPQVIFSALEAALEHSLANVPKIRGKVFICPDVSGSMNSPITGKTGVSVSTKMTCIDVASLFTAATLRVNPSASVLAFDTQIHPPRLSPTDSLAANTKILSSYGGGGTNCALPLHWIATKPLACEVDAIVMISDYESWAGVDDGRRTPMMQQWEEIKRLRPHAKLICIDLTPKQNSQTLARPDVLRVGGFSSAVFDVVADFINDGFGGDAFIRKVEAISLDDSKGVEL